MPWSYEEIEELKRLTANGLSANQIKDKIPGKTRSAILGKMFRLRLNSRYVKSEPNKLSLKTRSYYQTFTCDSIESLTVDIDRKDGKSLLDLKINECHWPFGEKDFSFCGRKTTDGRQYCGIHLMRSIRIAPKTFSL